MLRSLAYNSFFVQRKAATITDTAHSKRSNVWPLPRCDLKVFVQPINAAGRLKFFLVLAVCKTLARSCILGIESVRLTTALS